MRTNRQDALRLLLAICLITTTAGCVHDTPPQPQTTVNTTTRHAKPSTQDQIIGAWERIPMPAGVNKAEPWPLPYQYFAIMDDGRIGWIMTSEKQNNLTGKQLIEMLNHTHWHHYEFNKSGMLITYADNPGKEAWLLSTATEDFTIPDVPPEMQHQKGDLLMSKMEWVGQSLKPVYFRHLRRLPD